MEANQASLTAQLTSYVRAYHATHDDPKIFNDYLASQMISEAEKASLADNLAKLSTFLDPEHAATCPDQATAVRWVVQNMMNSTLSRSKFAEERLASAVAAGVRQYVILGAGMDTFAFRQPVWGTSLQVYEIDHPATQRYKQTRLSDLKWEVPPHLHFIPVDFTEESLSHALRRSPFSTGERTFYSWLGVTLYLPRDAVLATLKNIAELAPAQSTIVFDYMDLDAYDPKRADKRVQQMQQIVQRVGEPLKSGFDPAQLAATLSTVGLHLEEDLSPVEIEKEYYQGRTDGYHAGAHLHYARAVVK